MQAAAVDTSLPTLIRVVVVVIVTVVTVVTDMVDSNSSNRLTIGVGRHDRSCLILRRRRRSRQQAEYEQKVQG